jgi:hypothetical protein
MEMSVFVKAALRIDHAIAAPMTSPNGAAPTPAPTRPGGIAAPDTGSGGMESAAAGDAWPGLLALAAAAVLLGAGAKVMRRAR